MSQGLGCNRACCQALQHTMVGWDEVNVVMQVAHARDVWRAFGGQQGLLCSQSLL